MEYADAKELLPKFWHLVGTKSKTFEQEITDIFIGYDNGILTQVMYNRVNRVENFPYLDSDKGTYNICVCFQNGKLMDIKKLVQRDNLVDLIPLTEPLNYMSEQINEFEKDKDDNLHP